MKTKATIYTSLAVLALGLTGCGGGSPVPSKPDSKPTVYVESHTAEKFKDLTEATAVWNGIPTSFVKDKQYMRCDMTEEAIAGLTRAGLEVVTTKEQADYTFEVTLLSCGPYDLYHGNRSELPLQERELYKDFMKWVSEEPNEIPTDAKEIAWLISQNDPRGFERFHEENYIKRYGHKFGYSEYWNLENRDMEEYIRETKGIVLPNKYDEMPEEDRLALENLNKKFKEGDYKHGNQFNRSLHNINTGMAMKSAYSGNAGNVAIGVGLIMAIGSITPPNPINTFKVTDNRTGKSWEKESNFWTAPQNWKKNSVGMMSNAVIDEIPWSDLN